MHGIGGSAPSWRPLAAYLAAGAGVLAIDLAGHGAAGDVAGPYRIGRFAADVAEIAPAVSYRQFLAYVRDWLIGVSPSVCVRDF